MSEEESYYTRLYNESAKKGLHIAIPIVGSRAQKTEKLQIEVKAGDKVIDYEVVSTAENCESASQRLYRRMKKDKVI